jgi:hypothetical protein
MSGLESRARVWIVEPLEEELLETRRGAEKRRLKTEAESSQAAAALSACLHGHQQSPHQVHPNCRSEERTQEMSTLLRGQFRNYRNAFWLFLLF